MADYFFCRLDYGPSLSRTVEADYRVLEASVSAGSFECEGRITGRQTSVILTSTETGETATHSEEHSVATIELNEGTCTCGMH